MHERKVYHGKLHGENIVIRDTDNESKLCLVDYAYSNLCTRDAITLLVNASPSFCGIE
jgi:tRNA A-37 threonylcarbamoyl transferase component Bud32